MSTTQSDLKQCTQLPISTTEIGVEKTNEETTKTNATTNSTRTNDNDHVIMDPSQQPNDLPDQQHASPEEQLQDSANGDASFKTQHTNNDIQSQNETMSHPNEDQSQEYELTNKGDVVATTTTTITNSDTNPPNVVVENAEIVENVDSVLFGSMNSKIADVFAKHVESSIADGVETLPLLSDATRIELKKQLIKTFYRNVDIFEIYSERNILTTQMHSKRHRQRVLRLYMKHQQEGDEIFDENNKENGMNNDTQTQAVTKTKFQEPEKDKIPTVEQFQEIENDLQALKDKLTQARARRSKVIEDTRAVQAAEALSLEAMKALEQTEKLQIHESVTAAVMGRDCLEQLYTEGKELEELMKKKKRDREDDDDDDENNDLAAVTTKRKKLELEEEYKNQRAKISTTTESLVAIRSLLKHKGK